MKRHSGCTVGVTMLLLLVSIPAHADIVASVPVYETDSDGTGSVSGWAGSASATAHGNSGIFCWGWASFTGGVGYFTTEPGYFDWSCENGAYAVAHLSLSANFQSCSASAHARGSSHNSWNGWEREAGASVSDSDFVGNYDLEVVDEPPTDSNSYFDFFGEGDGVGGNCSGSASASVAANGEDSGYSGAAAYGGASMS